MKKHLIFYSITFLMASCGGSPESTEGTKNSAPLQDQTSATTENGNPSYDPNRGEGKYTSVDLGATLDVAKADMGEKIAGVKCFSCHKTTDEKLVGPGWKGVTERRQPHWILNFITNPDPMIDKDPAVQAQLELCLVRMPNQGLNDDEARSILEFMRKNDGVK
ncbi:MAG TPA: c-type cytochrome [Bacteroidia bacterium]|nr:c-type cytochrome [Bacteroidia bacterium]